MCVTAPEPATQQASTVAGRGSRCSRHSHGPGSRRLRATGSRGAEPTAAHGKTRVIRVARPRAGRAAARWRRRPRRRSPARAPTQPGVRWPPAPATCRNRSAAAAGNAARIISRASPLDNAKAAGAVSACSCAIARGDGVTATRSYTSARSTLAPRACNAGTNTPRPPGALTKPRSLPARSCSPGKASRPSLSIRVGACTWAIPLRRSAAAVPASDREPVLAAMRSQGLQGTRGADRSRAGEHDAWCRQRRTQRKRGWHRLRAIAACHGDSASSPAPTRAAARRNGACSPRGRNEITYHPGVVRAGMPPA